MQFCLRYGGRAAAYRAMLLKKSALWMRMLPCQGAMPQIVSATTTAIDIAK